MEKKSKFKSIISGFVKASFSIGLIVWLIKSGKLDFSLLSSLFNLHFLAIGLSIIGVSIAFAVERWRVLLRSQGIRISFLLAFKLSLVGTFFNFAMPGGVGGDLVKGFYISKAAPKGRVKAAFTVFFDRLIGLTAMTLLSLSVMAMNWPIIEKDHKLTACFYGILMITIALLFGWVIVFSKRFHNSGVISKIILKLPKSIYFQKVYNSLETYREIKPIFFKTLLYSFLAQLFALIFYIFAGKEMGFDIPISNYFIAIPIGFVIQALPISPGGVGIGQTALFYLFNSISEGSGHVGSSTTTAHQFILILFGLIGAFFYIGLTKEIKSLSKDDSK